MKIEQQKRKKVRNKEELRKFKNVSLIPKETQTSKQKSKRAKRKLDKKINTVETLIKYKFIESLILAQDERWRRA